LILSALAVVEVPQIGAKGANGVDRQLKNSIQQIRGPYSPRHLALNPPLLNATPL
jgi:hypothetical protein